MTTLNGSITKIQGRDGVVWRLFVSGGKDSSGRRIRITKRVRGTKAEASRQLRELVAEVESGRYIRPVSSTIRGFIEESWLPAIEPTLRPTTSENMRMYLRAYVLPRLGAMPLSKLTHQEIQNLYADLLERGGRNGRPLSRRTVLKVHSILREALSAAVRWELIGRNVAEQVQSPRPEKTEIKVLEPRLVVALLDGLKIRTPWAYAPTMLAFYTGLRRSEILGLTWGDVDLTAGTLSVRRAYHRLDSGEEVVRPPKSARSSRLVPLTRSTVEMLTGHRKEAEHTAGVNGRALATQNYIFAGHDGKPFRPDSLSQAFRRAAARLGLQGVRFHDTRHTHASLMLKAGVHPKVVSERLGHSSITITLDTYSHVMPGLQEAAAERLDQVMDEAVRAASETPALEPATS